jgi:hypothetical protein
MTKSASSTGDDLWQSASSLPAAEDAAAAQVDGDLPFPASASECFARPAAAGATASSATQTDVVSAEASFSAAAASAAAAEAWRVYIRCLAARPLQTKSLTAGALAVVSDLLATIRRKPGSLRKSALRKLRFFVFGCMWTGPTLHVWQRFVENAFRGSPPNNRTAVLKTVLDQTVHGPLQ